MATARKRTVWDVPGTDDIIDEKYRVEEVLGEGGLAVVVAAKHLQLQESVAIKMLLPRWAGNEEVIERFLREGRTAVRIRSEHVVRVFDVGVHHGAPYLVMERLEGSDLEALVREKGPGAVETVVDLTLQAIEAIAEAHAAGIVHRDLKPANLFLTGRADGSACIKVLDFGISKARTSEPGTTTSPELMMGSPPYMAPEQVVSTAAADERSDIWALGVVLYELLTGEPPFRGSTTPELCINVMHDTPKPPSSVRPEVPAALDATVLMCLEKDPNARFANVGELALALASFGTAAAHASAQRAVRVLQLASGIHITNPSVPRPLPEREEAELSRFVRRCKRSNVRFATIAGALLVALVMLGGYLAARVLRDRRATTVEQPVDVPPPVTSAAPSESVAPSLPSATSLAMEEATSTDTAPKSPPAPPAKQAAPPSRGTRVFNAVLAAPAAPAPMPTAPQPASPVPTSMDTEPFAPSAPPSGAPPPPQPPPPATNSSDPEGLFEDRK